MVKKVKASAGASLKVDDVILEFDDGVRLTGVDFFGEIGRWLRKFRLDRPAGSAPLHWRTTGGVDRA